MTSNDLQTPSPTLLLPPPILPTMVAPACPAHIVDWKKQSEEALYTFTNLRVLPHLPNPDASMRYLERLRDDPGIKKAMRRYRWMVGLLQEMEPVGNTDLNSKTLGKNWNKGQMIEVRLRTDAYDGYRPYEMVRLTMCHELAHMVHSEHDRQFWDLNNLLVKEVKAGDWKSGGRALTNEVFYEPPPERLQQTTDDGGWKGGSFKLGSSGGSMKGSLTGEVNPVNGQLTDREIRARAAEERLKRLASTK